MSVNEDKNLGDAISDRKTEQGQEAKDGREPVTYERAL